MLITSFTKMQTRCQNNLYDKCYLFWGCPFHVQMPLKGFTTPTHTCFLRYCCHNLCSLEANNSHFFVLLKTWKAQKWSKREIENPNISNLFSFQFRKFLNFLESYMLSNTTSSSIVICYKKEILEALLKLKHKCFSTGSSMKASQRCSKIFSFPLRNPGCVLSLKCRIHGFDQEIIVAPFELLLSRYR